MSNLTLIISFFLRNLFFPSLFNSLTFFYHVTNTKKASRNNSLKERRIFVQYYSLSIMSVRNHAKKIIDMYKTIKKNNALYILILTFL